MIHGVLCYKRKSTGSLYQHVCSYDVKTRDKVIAECKPGMDWTFVGRLMIVKSKIHELRLQFLDEPWPVEQCRFDHEAPTTHLFMYRHESTGSWITFGITTPEWDTIEKEWKRDPDWINQFSPGPGWKRMCCLRKRVSERYKAS